MRHKVKKNKAYRGNQLNDDTDDRIGIDKKTQHRKERRVFNSSNIRNAYSIITQNTKELDELEILEAQNAATDDETDDFDDRQKFG